MILGIDLGTTYSAAAYVTAEGDVEVIVNREGKKTTPSVCWEDADKHIVTGQVAKENAVQYPQDVFAGVKNDMAEGVIYTTSRGNQYTPERISGYIVEKMIQDAESYSKQKVTGVIITVPACFTNEKRNATLEAAKHANANLLGIINEPTAAMLSYIHKNNIEKGNYMVYDLGGGTFDVSVVNVNGDDITVLGTDGARNTGGWFFDKILINEVCRVIKEKHQIDLNQDMYKQLLQMITNQSEEYKKQLSAAMSINVPVFLGTVMENVTISKEFFESKLRSFYRDTENAMDMALEDAKLEKKDIDNVLLIGGSTRIPYIAERVTEYIGKPPAMNINPDEAVAIGAALFGQSKSAVVPDTKFANKRFQDTNSAGIGFIHMQNGERKNVIIIPKNSKLPISVTQEAYTTGAASPHVILSITEGNYERVESVKVITELDIKWPSELEKNTLIQIVYTLDEYQILHIHVSIPSIEGWEYDHEMQHLFNFAEAEEDTSLTLAGEARINETGKIVSEEIAEATAKEQKEKREEEKASYKKNQEASRIKKHSLADLLEKGLFSAVKKGIDRSLLRNAPTMEERFEYVVGMEDAKKTISRLYRTLKFQIDRKEANKTTDIIDKTHFFIMGERGTGKTLLAETIGKMFVDFGIRGEETAVSVEAKDFLEQFEKLDRLTDITVIIENIDRVQESDGSFGDFSWKLRGYLKDHMSELTVLITGTEKAVYDLMDKEPDIKDYIYASVSTGTYSVDELLRIFEIQAADKEWELSDEARAVVRKQINREHHMSTYAYGKSLAEKLAFGMANAADRYTMLEDPEEEDHTILKDVDFIKEGENKGVTELLLELDEMIGLTTVKQEISNLVKELRLDWEEQEKGIAKGESDAYIHMCFTGAPGTGKTTVARLIGQIYSELGILPGNEIGMLECDAADLISPYNNETFEKTKEVFNRAMGGVLFIDEAYTLMQGQNGQQAIDALNQLLGNHKNDILVIFAGYQDQMDAFLSSNGGLRSRIPHVFHFEDYTEDELISIFKGAIRSKKWLLDEEADDAITELIRRQSKVPDFGNGRGANNLANTVIKRHRAYLGDKLTENIKIDETEHMMITKEDIERVLNEENKIEPIEELMADLDAMTGLDEIKEVVHKAKSIADANVKLREAGMEPMPQVSLHMIFMGEAGTGKTTVARKIGKIYQALGILPRGEQIYEKDASDLLAPYAGQTAPKVKDAVKDAMGSILFIDEAYQFCNEGNPYGQDAIDALVADLENKKGKFVTILAGYDNEMEELLDKNSGLRSRFKIVHFEQMTPEMLYDTFMQQAKSRNYFVEEEAKPFIRSLLKRRSQEKGFGNGRGVRNILDDLISQIAVRISESVEFNALDARTIKKVDLEKYMYGEDSDAANVDETMKKLDSMIGLGSVKKAIHEKKAEIDNIMYGIREGFITEKEQSNLHMLFLGAPGTGKTTVARLVGEIYHSIGVLPKNVFVEVSGRDLVAGYIGQTNGKVEKFVDDAMGGVLFVDEAYTLASGGENDFGKEALDTLLKLMEDRRGEFMAIFAGYTEEVMQMLKMNQGATSRFPEQNWIYFEDYEESEMVDIFYHIAKSNNAIVSEELRPLIQESMTLLKEKTVDFANARTVRSFYENIVVKRRNRVNKLIREQGNVTGEIYNTIIEEDIRIARMEQIGE